MVKFCPNSHPQYQACAIYARIHANTIEIWTKINPNWFSNPSKIKRAKFQEELSSWVCGLSACGKINKNMPESYQKSCPEYLENRWKIIQSWSQIHQKWRERDPKSMKMRLWNIFGAKPRPSRLQLAQPLKKYDSFGSVLAENVGSSVESGTAEQ